MTRLIALLVAGATALALSGCGGESDAEKKKETAGAGRGEITCSGAAVTGVDFPRPDAVTYVKKSEAGPTTIVLGYSTDSLEDTYNAYKDALDEAGIEIADDELEEHDSEIEFERKNAGSEGQIALRATCDNGHVSVRITDRPA